MIDNTQYQLVYTIATDRCPWWILAVGLAPIAMGVLLLLIGRRVGALSIIGGLVWTAIAVPSALRCHSSHEALRAGRAQVVEGEIRNFHPMPPTGHDVESFEVSGVKFSYSDYIIAPGFHQSASRGGPIAEGRVVRIRHVGNDILTLEVLVPSG